MRRLLFISVAAFAFPAFADPLELVISPTRTETPMDEIGSAVTVITADDIARKQQPSVAALLREVPGVDVNPSGGPGQTVYVSLRGAPTEHTLVLIDGVAVNDPSSTAGAYDFSQLTTNNIERIEVLRGNESTLYGSNAIGGVISITTKRGSGAPTAYAKAEAGSYDTLNESAGSSGKVDALGYSVDVSHYHTNGFSAVERSFGGNQRDADDSTVLSSRIDGQINDQAKAYATLRYIQSRVDYEDPGAVFTPNASKPTEVTARAAVDYSAFGGFWDQELGVSDYHLVRDVANINDGDYRGTRNDIDWVNHLHMSKTNTVTLGAESERESFSSTFDAPAAYSISSVYVQDQLSPIENAFTTIGIRDDDHEIFGTKVTYRIAQSYLIPETNTQFKASYGTGFKAPSLFQLLSSFGNRELRPESSQGYDAGFEQKLPGAHVTFGSSYFRTAITDLIDFDQALNGGLGAYANVNSAHIQGVENTVSYAPLPALMLTANYTYTDFVSDNPNSNIRHPKHKVSLDADYSFLEKGRVGASVVYTGARNDIFVDPVTFASSRVAMPSNTVVNLNSSWQLTDRVQLFGRVDNLFDKHYEQLYTFATSGIAAYAGVRVQY